MHPLRTTSEHRRSSVRSHLGHLALAAAAALAPSGCGTGDASDPRVVVLVTIERLTPEQLERLGPHFSGGLARFLRQGQVWAGASHDHGVTQDGPGYATLATGVRPRRHGIVADSWYVQSERRIESCIADEGVDTLSGGGGVSGRTITVSPKNLAAATVADQIGAHSQGSVRVSIAGSELAAVLGAGQAADLVLWWDGVGRGFATTTHFAPTMPDWVTRWNLSWLEETLGSDEALVWEDELPEGLEIADERDGENDIGGVNTFPYVGPTQDPDPRKKARDHARIAQWVRLTPIVDRFVADTAIRAVDELALGTVDRRTDYLHVGLTASGASSGRFGPGSREAADALLRADRHLERLFQRLDERVGPGRWIAALGTDHGTLGLPEALTGAGEDAWRIPGRALYDEFEALREEHNDAWGMPCALRLLESQGLSLSESCLHAAGLDPVEVRREMAEAIAGRFEGIAYAFPREALAEAPETADEVLRLMSNSYHPERTPDVSLVLARNHVVMRVGTNHGTPWPYDRAAPMAFLGPGSPAETRDDPVRSIDLAPTLLERAGIPLPDGLDGVPLPAEP